MEEKAASVRDEKIEKLRKEIEEKALQDSIAKVILCKIYYCKGSI